MEPLSRPGEGGRRSTRGRNRGSELALPFLLRSEPTTVRVTSPPVRPLPSLPNHICKYYFPTMAAEKNTFAVKVRMCVLCVCCSFGCALLFHLSWCWSLLLVFASCVCDLWLCGDVCFRKPVVCVFGVSWVFDFGFVVVDFL